MAEKINDPAANKKEGAASYNAPLIYKAFALLEEVAGHQAEFGISDLARRLSISKSTIFGITQALTDLNALTQDPVSKKFSLGPILVRLGNQALAGVDLRAVAWPYMEALSQKYRETVFLGNFDENGISIIEKADSPAALKITAPVGTRIPRYAGATGKVYLSSLRDPVVKKTLKEKPLPRYTENSIIDPQVYMKELQKVRAQGFATDFEEYLRGVNAISVPVVRELWGYVGAIWIVGFSSSFSGDKLKEAIFEAQRVSEQISKVLGG